MEDLTPNSQRRGRGRGRGRGKGSSRGKQRTGGDSMDLGGMGQQSERGSKSKGPARRGRGRAASSHTAGDSMMSDSDNINRTKTRGRSRSRGGGADAMEINTNGPGFGAGFGAGFGTVSGRGGAAARGGRGRRGRGADQMDTGPTSQSAFSLEVRNQQPARGRGRGSKKSLAEPMELFSPPPPRQPKPKKDFQQGVEAGSGFPGVSHFGGMTFTDQTKGYRRGASARGRGRGRGGIGDEMDLAPTNGDQISATRMDTDISIRANAVFDPVTAGLFDEPVSTPNAFLSTPGGIVTKEIFGVARTSTGSVFGLEASDAVGKGRTHSKPSKMQVERRTRNSSRSSKIFSKLPQLSTGPFGIKIPESGTTTHEQFQDVEEDEAIYNYDEEPERISHDRPEASGLSSSRGLASSVMTASTTESAPAPGPGGVVRRGRGLSKRFNEEAFGDKEIEAEQQSMLKVHGRLLADDENLEASSSPVKASAGIDGTGNTGLFLKGIDKRRYPPTTLRKLFGKFGKLVGDIKYGFRGDSAVIRFADHASAAKAKKNASKEFQIFWDSKGSAPSATAPPTETIAKPAGGSGKSERPSIFSRLGPKSAEAVESPSTKAPKIQKAPPKSGQVLETYEDAEDYDQDVEAYSEDEYDLEDTKQGESVSSAGLSKLKFVTRNEDLNEEEYPEEEREFSEDEYNEAEYEDENVEYHEGTEYEEEENEDEDYEDFELKPSSSLSGLKFRIQDSIESLSDEGLSVSSTKRDTQAENLEDIEVVEVEESYDSVDDIYGVGALPKLPTPPTQHEGTLPKPLKISSEASRSKVRISKVQKQKSIRKSLPKRTIYSSEQALKASGQARMVNEKIIQANTRKAQEALQRAIELVPWPENSLVGTCETMCPASELYRRTEGNQLTSFEIIPNLPPGVRESNLDYAVKKYRRSDAHFEVTQDEIRPVPVLEMTLEYLLTDILEGSDAPFFSIHNFIRDRMRSIMQDLSLQTLDTHPCAYEILARCIRFFILSDHLLCEEDQSHFDPGQNAEVLSKALISMMNMFATCRRAGIELPQEAEFRSYQLLILHEPTEFLNELKKLPSWLLPTTLIQHAILTRQYRDNKNYAGFFKLVEEADYLTSCLMHRYFRTVRRDGLELLNKVLQKRERVSIIDLIEIFKFEDKKEAISFCEDYSLPVVDASVPFGQNKFTIPQRSDEGQEGEKIVFFVRRSDKWIETKRIGFSNRDLTILSPDERSISKQEQVPEEQYMEDVEEEFESDVEYYEESEEMYEEEESEPVEEMVSMSPDRDKVGIFPATNVQYSFGLTPPPTPQRRLISSSSPLIPPATRLSGYVDSEKRQSSISEFPAAFAIHQTSEPQARPQSLYDSAPYSQSQPLSIASSSQLRMELRAELAEDVEKRQRQIKLEEERVQQEIRRERQAGLLRSIRLLTAGRYFRKWTSFIDHLRKNFLLFRQRRRHLSTTSLEDQSAKTPIRVHPSLFRTRPEPLSAETTLISPPAISSEFITVSEINAAISKATRERARILKKYFVPLDVPSIIYPLIGGINAHLPNDYPVYWKLLLFADLPDSDEYYDGEDTVTLVSYIGSKLSLQPNPLLAENLIRDGSDQKLLAHYAVDIGKHKPKERELHIAINLLRDGYLSQDQLLPLSFGSSAVIIILSPSHGLEANQYWDAERERISFIVSSLPDSHQVPLLLITSIHSPKKVVREVLRPLSLDSANVKVMSILPTGVPSRNDNRRIAVALKWLAAQTAPQPLFPVYSLVDVLQWRVDELLSRLTKLMHPGLKRPRDPTSRTLLPDDYTDAFNGVVDFICRAIDVTMFPSVSFPAPEFSSSRSLAIPPKNWNSTERCAQLLSILNHIRLPPLALTPSSNQLQTTRILKSYIRSMDCTLSSQTLDATLSSIVTDHFVFQNNETARQLNWMSVFRSIYLYRCQELSHLLQDHAEVVLFGEHPNYYQRFHGPSVVSNHTLQDGVDELSTEEPPLKKLRLLQPESAPSISSLQTSTGPPFVPQDTTSPPSQIYFSPQVTRLRQAIQEEMQRSSIMLSPEFSDPMLQDVSFSSDMMPTLSSETDNSYFDGSQNHVNNTPSGRSPIESSSLNSPATGYLSNEEQEFARKIEMLKKSRDKQRELKERTMMYLESLAQ